MWPSVSFLWFSSKRRNLLLAKSQHFFTLILRPTFGLLGNSCQYFSLLPVSQKMCSRWRPGSIPPRALNALTFSHTASLPGRTQKSISTAKLTESPVSLEVVSMSVRKTVNIFWSLWPSDKFNDMHLVNRKKEHFWNIRKPKVPLFNCSAPESKNNPLSSLCFS